MSPETIQMYVSVIAQDKREVLKQVIECLNWDDVADQLEAVVRWYGNEQGFATNIIARGPDPHVQNKTITREFSAHPVAWTEWISNDPREVRPLPANGPDKIRDAVEREKLPFQLTSDMLSYIMELMVGQMLTVRGYHGEVFSQRTDRNVFQLRVVDDDGKVRLLEVKVKDITRKIT